MEGITATETRQRVIKWIEEGQYLVGLVQGLLEENGQLGAGARVLEQECEMLRLENGRLQREREEIVGAFSKLMTELLRPMDEMMQKLRGMQKSPFERETSAIAPE
jgi:hypothetical protein